MLKAVSLTVEKKMLAELPGSVVQFWSSPAHCMTTTLTVLWACSSKIPKLCCPLNFHAFLLEPALTPPAIWATLARLLDQILQTSCGGRRWTRTCLSLDHLFRSPTRSRPIQTSTATKSCRFVEICHRLSKFHWSNPFTGQYFLQMLWAA